MTLKQRIRERLLILLKHTLNPLTRRLARTAHGPFAIIQHVGRRSGKQYETPIILGRAADGFVLELTYGPNVDWYKNVQAAGGCTLIWHRKTYRISKLELLIAERGRSAFPLPARLILRLIKAQHFVKMTVERSEEG
jgi:deazaflavin-dependent oxidoreductase (nitroreductase family)